MTLYHFTILESCLNLNIYILMYGFNRIVGFDK